MNRVFLKARNFIFLEGRGFALKNIARIKEFLKYFQGILKFDFYFNFNDFLAYIISMLSKTHGIVYKAIRRNPIKRMRADQNNRGRGILDLER